MKLVLSVVLAGLFLFSPCAFSEAEAMPEVLFILDSSGSMHEPSGAHSKMEAAKSVLREVIPSMPPEAKMGLVVYGHRTPRDCQDVEIMVEPGAGHAQALLERVEQMQPVGQTPIALALTKASDYLKNRKSETSIVLVSDGEETCGGDPCAVVKALKSAGVHFVLHVVGFNVDEAARLQLTCMAEAGGGLYFSAGDAAALKAALEAVRGHVQEKVEKAKTTAVKKTTGLGKLNLTLPEEALKSVATIKLVRTSDGKVVKEGKLDRAESIHPLPAGAYEFILGYANPNYKPPTECSLGSILIHGGETTELALGALSYNLAEGLADRNISAVVIQASGMGKEVVVSEDHGNDYYLFKAKPLLPGVYDVAIRYYRSPGPSVLIATNIVVAEGKTGVATVQTGVALKEPAAGGVQGWDLIPSGADKPVLQVRRGHDNNEPLWRRFMILPGTYSIQVLMKDMDEPLLAGEEVQIVSGETLEFDTGL